MPEDPTPPRKKYGFKEPEFESLNQPPAATPKLRTTRTPKLLPDEVKPPEPVSSRPPAPLSAGARPPGSATRPGLPGTRPALAGTLPPVGTPATDPGATEARKLRLKPVPVEPERVAGEAKAPVERGSRRMRDYLFCLGIGNLIGVVAIVIVPVLGIAAVVLYNVALAWVLFGLLDDY